MKLRDRLNAMKVKLESEIPSEALEVIHQANDELKNSGILERVLNVGDKMPEIALPDSAGNMVQLSDVLAKGPLVLTFFRGQW